MNLERIVIAGGSGLIGQALVDYLTDYAMDIVVLSRSDAGGGPNYRRVHWDGQSAGDWQTEVDGCDVLINLSGKSIQCRFTDENKKKLRASRLRPTDILRQTVGQCADPPSVWFNGSGTGIYPKGETVSTEQTKEIADDFLGHLCRDWEAAFFDEHLPDTRRVAMRTSPVLSPNGGMLSPIKTATRLGGGGKQGDGQQWFSWIHVDDMIRGVHFLIHEDGIDGPVNMCSPHPVRNEEFMASMRKAVGMPIGIPTPAFALKLASPIIGVEPSLALDSIRVSPTRLEAADFLFEFPEIGGALHDLL